MRGSLRLRGSQVALALLCVSLLAAAGCHESGGIPYDAGAASEELCGEGLGNVGFEEPLPPADDDAGSDDDAGGEDPTTAEESSPEEDSPEPFQLPAIFDCEGETALDAEPSLARNVLFFLGDGMGPGQIEAARRQGPLHLDELAEHGTHGMLNTDSLTSDGDSLTATDSAASATAFATGVRTQNGRLAIDGSGEPVPSVLDLAQAEGKAVGLVTTSYLYDASPMAFAVHTTDRFANQDILEQLFSREPIDVLMGGGAGLLGPELPGTRERARALGYTLVLNEIELRLQPLHELERVLGLFSPRETPGAFGFGTTPVCERTRHASDPSLPFMTERALHLLEQDPQGFFLFVENENTDSYGHNSILDPELSAIALPLETRYLDQALGVALEWVAKHSSFEETLIVLTSDHDTGGFNPGQSPDHRPTFQSGAHTRIPVDVFARGPGEKSVARMCRMSDLYLLLSGRVR